MRRSTEQLTDRGIRSLKAEGQRVEVMDGAVPGLGLRVLPTGRKSWFLRYGPREARRRIVLGPYPALSLEAARNKARELVADVKIRDRGRIALVIQLASDPRSTEVGKEAMQAGVTISAWFESQARRVYHRETAQERDRREVCEWIREQGGKITRRQLQKDGPYRFRKGVDEVLDDLVTEGLAKRQGRYYVLCGGDNSDGEAQ